MRIERDVKLSVMTWNIYFGADLASVFTASPEQIPQRVTEVFRQFLATNFLQRAKAIADQIMDKEPDIIGLQEAVLWELIPPNSARVAYDFIDILLHELRCRGQRYIVAAINQNAEAALPSSGGNLIRLSDRDVILIRETSDIDVMGKQEANFKTNLQIQIAGQTFTVLRGWSYIDVCFQGHVFRIVNTHLDPNSPVVQVAQANELLDGPGETNLPLIFIGDFNSDANGSGTQTYANLIAAGFEDTWLDAGKGKGLTCCQDADLLNADSRLNERIDLILIKNNKNWDAAKSEVVGEAQIDRTETRLWPSDHAGVITKLKLKGCKFYMKGTRIL